MPTPLPASAAPSFGLLIYSDTDNLGDEIQSLAARRFLPRQDYLLDREYLAPFQPDHAGERVRCIMNGWYCHRPDRFGFPASLDPLLTSIHVTPAARLRFAQPDIVDTLRAHGPVGARDRDTLAFLLSLDLEAYFSGCMTLTLPRPDVAPGEHVAVNDVPAAFLGRIAAATMRNLVLTRHQGHPEQSTTMRFAKAEALLRTYASAHAVITTRLHCALPCIAMNTPVLLITTATDRERFAGLLDLVHHCSPEEFLDGRIAWNPDDPPPNPGRHAVIRHDLIRRANRFIAG